MFQGLWEFVIASIVDTRIISYDIDICQISLSSSYAHWGWGTTLHSHGINAPWPPRPALSSYSPARAPCRPPWPPPWRRRRCWWGEGEEVGELPGRWLEWGRHCHWGRSIVSTHTLLRISYLVIEMVSAWVCGIGWRGRETMGLMETPLVTLATPLATPSLSMIWVPGVMGVWAGGRELRTLFTSHPPLVTQC